MAAELAPNSVVDTLNPYFGVYRKYVVQHPFYCPKCRDYHGSITGASYKGLKLCFQFTCENCAERWNQQFTLEQIREFAERYNKEDFPMAWVFEMFIALITYRYMWQSEEEYFDHLQKVRKLTATNKQNPVVEGIRKLWRYLTVKKKN